MRKVIEIPDPDDSWAEVELYRWQTGYLPGELGRPEVPLDVVAGLRGMADAIDKRDLKNFPDPMNVVEVLRYCARRLAKPPAPEPLNSGDLMQAMMGGNGPIPRTK